MAELLLPGLWRLDVPLDEEVPLAELPQTGDLMSLWTALAGSSLVSMIYYTSLGPTWKELMSSAFLSIEIVQALASSIGVILAVPVTVLIGMLMYGHAANRTAKKTEKKAAR